MRLGFSGTRNGMSEQQKQAFRAVVDKIQPESMVHGCCVGADEDAVVIVTENFPECRVHARPGYSASAGSNEYFSSKAMSLSHDVHPKKPHFARNRDIVHFSNLLIATPWQSREDGLGDSGGTAYTIRHALKMHIPVIIIWPDGSEERRE
jgi:hypothetical protein